MKHFLIAVSVISSLQIGTCLACGGGNASIEGHDARVLPVEGEATPGFFTPGGRWITDKQLEIRFVAPLEAFDEIDVSSLQYKVEEDTITVSLAIHQIPHPANAPVPACLSSRMVVYEINDIPHKNYMVQIDEKLERLIAADFNALSVDDAHTLSDSVRIVVNGNGSLSVNGSITDLNGTRAIVMEAISGQIPVWIYADPQYRGDTFKQVFEFLLSSHALFSVSTKADFSDYVDESGKSRPRIKVN